MTESKGKPATVEQKDAVTAAIVLRFSYANSRHVSSDAAAVEVDESDRRWGDEESSTGSLAVCDCMVGAGYRLDTVARAWTAQTRPERGASESQLVNSVPALQNFMKCSNSNKMRMQRRA